MSELCSHCNCAVVGASGRWCSVICFIDQYWFVIVVFVVKQWIMGNCNLHLGLDGSNWWVFDRLTSQWHQPKVTDLAPWCHWFSCFFLEVLTRVVHGSRTEWSKMCEWNAKAIQCACLFVCLFKILISLLLHGHISVSLAFLYHLAFGLLTFVLKRWALQAASLSRLLILFCLAF